MPTFVIGSENTIEAVAGRRPKGASGFRTEPELRKATADWPSGGQGWRTGGPRRARRPPNA